jgi:hypothetical protein
MDPAALPFLCRQMVFDGSKAHQPPDDPCGWTRVVPRRAALLSETLAESAMSAPAAFRKSLDAAVPPDGIGPVLRALWYEAKGDWNRAHESVQDQDGVEAAWVHAYLHRKEGDLSNAAYWYRRAGKPVARHSLEEEWTQIATALLRA